MRNAVAVYAHWSGAGGSGYTVAHGIRRALERAKLSWFPVDLRGRGDELSKELADRGRRMFTGGHVERIARAPSTIALLAAWPAWWRVIPRHQVSYGYHVVEGTEVSADWWPELLEGVRVWTASTWGADVLERVMGRRPGIARHGVAVTQQRSPTENGQFLHFCSSVAFPDRKATVETIRGFAMHSREYPEHRLDVAVPPDQYSLDTLARLLGLAADGFELTQDERDRVSLVTTRFVDADELARFASRYQAVVAPSRGEGFGLVPLELLAAGLPVITTMATGHYEYIYQDMPGVVLVPHGPLELCPPVGEAPRVTPKNIARALDRMTDEFATIARDAADNAGVVATRWAWHDALRPLVADLEATWTSSRLRS